MSVKLRWLDHSPGFGTFYTEVVEVVTSDGNAWLEKGRPDHRWTDAVALEEEQRRAERRVAVYKAEEAIAAWKDAKEAMFKAELKMYRLETYLRYGIS